MRPAMLVPSAVKGWVMVHFLEDAQGKDLLTHLVAVGKVMALVQALLPEEDPALLLGYTEQVKRARRGERVQHLKELVRKKMLYSGVHEPTGRIMSDGPFTNGFRMRARDRAMDRPADGAPNYLKDHPNTTFAQLFSMKILAKACLSKSYRPR
ncbi:MAG: hypothetical protein IPG69_21160 [Flavobacteriales bacterium]|nr:hypothetical protein [Flavobacteriales bacterium]